MHILLLGTTGQTGFELHRTLAPLGAITAPTRQHCDLSDPESVVRQLNATQPNLIVNAAAYTAVDQAESEPELANRLNAELPAQLADWSATHNAKLVHYSTDYVYPGTGAEPWQETSAAGPLNTYGHTKLKGDRAIEQSQADHLVFRTSWVYSARGHNFMNSMLKLAATKTELNIVADQTGAPTPARLIAGVTALAIHHKLPQGLYHLAPRGETTWHHYAQEIFRLAGKTLRVNPIPTRDYPTPAQRPKNSRLDLNKLETALSITLPHWQTQLKLSLQERLGNNHL